MFGFSDETYIDVSSGKGGAGCVSFRRDKFVPKGGPDGGDGGKGGDVVFVVSDNLRTLDHLKLIRVFRAENGQPGMGQRMYGRNGKDVEIAVPPGTVIKDAKTGDLIKDLTGCERYTLLKGGRGGLGNWHFRNSVRQAPKFAQPGEKGEEMRVGLELLIIADIGFVGFPNAGKSSLLNLLTNARSKVAPYPFTTKIPHLGMMRYDDRDIVLADIPGILEGASEGVGMGFKFLKHISRTRGIAYFVDVSEEGYLDALDKLMNEVKKYSIKLFEKPFVVLGTKVDEEDGMERFEALKAKYSSFEVLPLSIYIDELFGHIKSAFMRLVGNEGHRGESDGGFKHDIDLNATYEDEND